jgi:hypothetical protein
MHRTWLLAEEIPCRIMGRRGLGNLTVGTGFYGMNKIRELDRVLDEENRNVITDNV